MRVVTVPVRLVNLMREVLVEEVANCAGEIRNSGHSHPDFGIDPQELEDFEVYRVLLEQVGAIRTTPTVAVELRLRRRAHRAALTGALHRRVEFERYLMDVDRDFYPEGPRQARISRRHIKHIETFLAAAGLEKPGATVEGQP
jgi:hypothetical protein